MHHPHLPLADKNPSKKPNDKDEHKPPHFLSRWNTSGTGDAGPDTRQGFSLVLVERKKEVSGESAGVGLESFGWAVGYEGLAGCDSVDAAYFLNGLFQKLLRAVGPESRQYVERSRYYVCLCKVRDSLEFSQNRVEAAFDFQESEC